MHMRLRREIVASFGLLLLLMEAGCQKRAPTSDVIYVHATSGSVLADGSSLDTIYADLPVNTLAQYRAVTFGATSGLFANGFDTMTVLATRTDIDEGKITAVAVFRASLRSGPDTVSATSSTVPEFIVYAYLNLMESTAGSIQLIPGAYLVKNMFGMQDSFTAILQNVQGGMVSIGGTVEFTASTPQGGAAGGLFYPPVANVDSSQVATAYFPPLLDASDMGTGNYINVTAQAYDINKVMVGQPATIQIFISP